MNKIGPQEPPQIIWASADTIGRSNPGEWYLRKEIISEFEKSIRENFNGVATSQKLFRFDTANNGYVTPVLDYRYIVVWYKHKDENVIDAVFYTPFFADLEKTPQPALGEYVRRLVEKESKGMIILPAEPPPVPPAPPAASAPPAPEKPKQKFRPFIL